ncbi:MAG: phosphoribosylformylglycinamidine synthase subunit PurQ [Desulfosudaceae bacterium]
MTNSANGVDSIGAPSSKDSRVRALVLCGYGLNCDRETAYALELAGAAAERVHINELISGEKRLDDFHVLAFVGGFSWGDDHGAGVICAHRLKTRLGDGLVNFVARGGLVIGICNGFQTLVNLGLLPGLEGDYRRRSVALIANDCGNFRDDWVRLAVTAESPCVFTSGLDQIDLPIRHGEGKFYCAPEIAAGLAAGHQVALRYADAAGQPAGGSFPANPNGSLDDIAGICDPTGRVFGLMPHPEACLFPTSHPGWTRRKVSSARRRNSSGPDDQTTDGVRIFKNGVDFVRTTSL